LLTTGQPSSNPRLVKEADALSEAGYAVRAIGVYWSAWADRYDQDLLAQRSWSFQYVAGHPRHNRLPYIWTRLRHAFSRRLLRIAPNNQSLRRRALWRAGSELEQAAKLLRADLYIAHNLGALPAAVAAAQTHRARAAFDAEDFHSGSRRYDQAFTVIDDITVETEWRFLPQCSYITAASPGIGAAYAARYNILKPVPILNVFPLSQRPSTFRPSSDNGPLSLYWFSQTIGAGRGLEDVITAMGHLRTCRIELHLRGQWSPGYREHLQKYAAAAGVSLDRIIAHDPALPDDMARLASEFDVGLAVEHPASLNRDLCLTNKIFTYLLAGNAIAATATRGQEPVMCDIGDAGCYYRPGHPDELAHCLQYWYNNRHALQAARRQAWQLGTGRYNWDIEKARFLSVVAQTLDDVSAG
jgi:glycosyltransferase involved in cell wall biosynthesis